MNENYVIVENANYKIIKVSDESIAIVPKGIVGKLNVIFDLEHGVQTKGYLDNGQKEGIFNQTGVKEMVASGSRKDIYFIPFVNNSNVDANTLANVCDYNFKIMSGVINSPVVNDYIDKQNLLVGVVYFNDKDKMIVDGLEKKLDGENGATNFFQGQSFEEWLKKLDEERVSVLETPKVSLEQNVIVGLETKDNDVLSNSDTVTLSNDMVNNSVIQSTNISRPNDSNMAPVVHVSGNGPTGISDVKEENNHEFNGTAIDHSIDVNSVNSSLEKDGVVRKLTRAGFVKFPVFLLTVIAIGALGIFVGKMFYSYLSQR